MYADEILIEHARYHTEGELGNVCHEAIPLGINGFQKDHGETTVVEMDDEHAVRLVVGAETVVRGEISRAPLTKTVMGFYETPGGEPTGDGLGVLTRMAGSEYVGRDHGTLSVVFVASIVESLLNEVHKRLSVTLTEHAFVASTEVLISRLSGLLDERSALIQELVGVYEERDVALAKIDQLEAINKALQSELYRTKRKRDPGLIAQYAIAITTLLGPVAAVVAVSEMSPAVQETVDSAHQVQVDCGNHTIIVNP